MEWKSKGSEDPRERAGTASRRGSKVISKTQVAYWRARVERRAYKYGGGEQEVSEYSVRMKFGGVRRRLTLGTSSKEDAAIKARDIYVSLIAKGWTKTLEERVQKPGLNDVRDPGAPTVGDFLAEVKRVGNLKSKTFLRYAQYFRMLAAHICGADSDVSKFDYSRGGVAVWRKRVEAVSLSEITPAAAADWKVDYLGRAGDNPRRKFEVHRSFNAALRHCRSLFSPRIINRPNFKVKVPKFKVPDGQRGEREVYWFECVDFERAGSMKFQAPAGVTYGGLVTLARDELRTTHPEAYKLFLLCLCAGLRRAEADVCLWSQLNADDNSIRVESNEFIEPKHGSGGTVYVDPSLMNELVRFKGRDAGRFVVESALEWKQSTYPRYRCAPHWRKLTKWLEEKGINARKKIHELRKIFGDAIVKQRGIFAGSAQLRHSTIQMTANHYVDPRERAALPLGDLLTRGERDKPLDSAEQREDVKKGKKQSRVIRSKGFRI